MAEQKHKSPEELGEAVGKKIEELFGSMFDDEEPSEAPPASTAAETVAPSQLKPVPRAGEPTKPGVVPPAPVPVQTRPPRPVQQEAVPRPPSALDRIIERIEILVLNLEWEISPEAIREIADKFGEVEKIIPSEGPAKAIVVMNRRVLPRFASKNVAPHRSLLKLLQDSVSALKTISVSGGKKVPDPTLIASISNSYKEISSAVPAKPESPTTQTQTFSDDEPVRSDQQFKILAGNLSGVSKGIEEVSQRLSRILGVFRQGREMSAEDILRRLGTLDHLLSDRVAQLSKIPDELAKLPVGGQASSKSETASTEGLLLIIWAGIPLAVQTSVLTGAYPLSREQGEQYSDKITLNIGNKQARRLPLKRPQGAAGIVPAWLIDLSHAGKEFFLLADKLLGFKRAPEGMELNRQAKLKIGPTTYTLINQNVLR